MSLIRAANLTRHYGSGTASAAGIVVGLKNDPDVIANLATALGINASSPWGYSIPIQWEVKNDDTAVTLQFTFAPTGFVASYTDVVTGVTIMDNWINLVPGQSFTMQKRHYEQEYTQLGSYDLYRMYVRGAGGNPCPFSVTVDIWTPSTGA